MVAARTLQSAAALALSPWMCQCVSTVSSWRVYGACTAFAWSIIVFIALSETAMSCHGNHCAPAALPLRPPRFAITLWANPTKWYKSSLVIATPIVCTSFVDLLMAVECQQAGLFLANMHVQQVQNDANAVHLIQRRMRRRAPSRRRVWVRQWLDVDRRLQYGHYHRLMYGLRYKDSASYFNFLRVPPNMFDELLGRLGPLIAKQDTPCRKALEQVFKLAMTMRHLASGDRYASMKFDFRVPHNTMSVCVREVCQALIDEYNDECIQCPTTAAEWREISEAFGSRWNVPHACAAFDGKHVACRRPRNSGSLYFNYKSVFSIVLMGLVDSAYKFLWIDVGGCGHMSDARLFNASELKECL